jgi:hypothetical protein
MSGDNGQVRTLDGRLQEALTCNDKARKKLIASAKMLIRELRHEDSGQLRPRQSNGQSLRFPTLSGKPIPTEPRTQT